MTILLADRHYSFAVFDRDGACYLTALATGARHHDLTMRLTPHEVATFRADRNKAIATSIDLVRRTAAYRERLVDPPIRPG